MKLWLLYLTPVEMDTIFTKCTMYRNMEASYKLNFFLLQIIKVEIVTIPTKHTNLKRKPQIDGQFLNELHIYGQEKVKVKSGYYCAVVIRDYVL